MTATFSDLAPMTGRGLWWGMQVSFNDFATISYNWATQAGDVVIDAVTYSFQRRLAGSSDILRGFGQDHLPAAAAGSFVIDNTDFVADWMVNRGTVETQVLRARFRLFVGLTTNDANVYQATVAVKRVGTFVSLDYPRRNDRAILLSLTDDSLGSLADVLIAPSLREWFDAADTDEDNSVFPAVKNIGDVTPLVDWNVPAPLQFGRGPFEAVPACVFKNNRTPADFDTFPTGHRPYIYPIVVLATRKLGAIDTGVEVSSLTGIYRKDAIYDASLNFGKLAGQRLDIPDVFRLPGGTIDRRIWLAYKTQTLTKDGYDWQLLWIAFDVLNYALWMEGIRTPPNGGTGSAPSIVIPCSPAYPTVQWVPAYASPVGAKYDLFDAYFSAFDKFLVNGSPGSGVLDGVSPNPAGQALAVMADLIDSYSVLGSAARDTTRFDRASLAAKAIWVKGSIVATGQGSAVSGEQQLSTKKSPYGLGTLRKAIAALAGSSDLDVFMTTEGKVAVVHQGADFETATTTYPVVYEERINGVEDRTPSAGERWSPYNRVFLDIGEGGQIGPFDNADAIDDWGRIISRVLPSRWWADVLPGVDRRRSAFDNGCGMTDPDAPQVWNLRSLEAKVRPIINFTTDLGVVVLELGDYFTMAWTRGGVNSAYASTLWRVESMTIKPSKGEVEVTAVWMEDLRTDKAYLLDNEDLLVRVQPTGAPPRTLTVTDGSDLMVASSGSFISDGVAIGDQVRLLDSSEDRTTFFRKRFLTIVDINSATQIQVDTADLDFGTPGAHVLAYTDWAIWRAQPTYPTAISDVTNYPSGGTMYGKVTDATGHFADLSEGNKLLDG